MNRNFCLSFLTLSAALLSIGEAAAVTVAVGCAGPVAPAYRNIYYVDPSRGSMSNDGSLARPWRTLAEVVDSKNKLIATQAYAGNYQNSDRKLVDQNSSAPIKPGDVINLLSGDHGNVQISGAVNKEFITIQAAPGQIAVLRSLRIDGAAKWMFLGLKIQGAGDGSSNSVPGSGLVDFGYNIWKGPTSDIIFSGGSVSTANDSSSWADVDWVKKPFMFGLRFNAACVTISNNHFFNLRNVLAIEGDHSLIANNKINDFGNDAIDLIASHVVIRNNMITNGRHTISELMHADGIQGWTQKDVTNRNIVIEGNMIVNAGEKNNLQGITIFDGKWDGLAISNNVVVTNHWHGISIYGVNNVKITNNTVVGSDPLKFQTWITVQNAKDGRSSRNAIIRNNITTRLNYAGDNITVDHNIVARLISYNSLGKPIFVSKPGGYGDGNIIDPAIYNTLMNVDHDKQIYDLRPKSGSPAIGAGSTEDAPTIDIVGKRRSAPIDIGAYAR